MSRKSDRLKNRKIGRYKYGGMKKEKRKRKKKPKQKQKQNKKKKKNKWEDRCLVLGIKFIVLHEGIVARIVSLVI